MVDAFVRSLSSRSSRGLGRRAAASAGAVAIVALTTLLAASPTEAQPRLVSVALDGTPSTGLRPALSANGRFVAFASAAPNLVVGDTNGKADVFVRDLVTNTTTRVSVTSTGAEGTADSGTQHTTGAVLVGISDDGNIVVFTSEAQLVPDDVNQSCEQVKCADIYAHDRTTGITTRVSVATDGTQGNAQSLAPDLSGDGRYVVFTSTASNLVPGDTAGTVDVFLHDRTTHTTTRVNEQTAGAAIPGANLPRISADGNVIAFIATGRVFFKTRSTGALVERMGSRTVVNYVGLNADGSVAVLFGWSGRPGTVVVETLDLTTGSRNVSPHPEAPEPIYFGMWFGRDGRTCVTFGPFGATIFDLETGIVRHSDHANGPESFDASGRYQAFRDANRIYVEDRDPDEDGMLTFWEEWYGLDPGSAADAALDPDQDGVSNLQEFLASSHPKGVHRRYFAEGASNAFFSTQLDLFVPGDAHASVVIRALGANARRTSRSWAIQQAYFWTVAADTFAPDTVYSTVIESDRPIVADRLMTWDAARYGSHLESGIDAPATSWYLAEGATGGPFSLFYLLQNPGAVETRVTVDYLRPAPLPVITKHYDVPAHSRFTVDVAGQDPGLGASEVSAKITAPAPIVVERAMYRSRPEQPFAAGHAGAGIAAPATRWFLAEGVTGFFDEYVLIANAEPTAATIKLTFLLPDAAATFTDTIDVVGHSRYTVDLKRYPALAATPVSVIVESTNTVPVVVERVLWWPTGDPYEASLSAGVTSTGTKWAIAGGRQGHGRQTFVLVANTDPTRDGQVRITLHPAQFEGAAIQTTLDVPRNGRATLDVGTILPPPRGTEPTAFSITVEGLDGLPIVVERSLYDNADGVPFAAGATSVATNITPVP